MTEKCEDCGKEVSSFFGNSRLYDDLYCIDCYKKRNPPVKKCPECSKLMLKNYSGRLHSEYPPAYNFVWTCQCSYREYDVDGLKNHYIDQLVAWLNDRSESNG